MGPLHEKCEVLTAGPAEKSSLKFLKMPKTEGVSVAHLCLTLCDPTDQSLAGKNTAVGCHFLLQGTFPTQGLNLCFLLLLHLKVDSLPLSHQGNPLTI